MGTNCSFVGSHLKRMSSRTSAHAGVAISSKSADFSLKSIGIATPFFGMARNDRIFGSRLRLSNCSTSCNLYSSNDTERVREVTTRIAPITQCPWGHPHKLQFEGGTDGKNLDNANAQ